MAERGSVEITLDLWGTAALHTRQIPAVFGQGFTGQQLHLQPLGEFVLFRPNLTHDRAGIAFNHMRCESGLVGCGLSYAAAAQMSREKRPAPLSDGVAIRGRAG